MPRGPRPVHRAARPERPLVLDLLRPSLAGAALVGILLLLAAVAVTTILFRRLDRTAGWLMLPYLVWVAHATTLNAGVWVMN